MSAVFARLHHELSYMEVVPMGQRLAVSVLSLLLVSCSTTRGMAVAPEGVDELSHSVLIIEQLPDGRVAHSWQTLEEFDFSRYPSLPGRQSVVGEVVPAAWTRDCEQERDECEDDCMRGRMRPGYGHVTTPDRKRGGKSDFCRKKCMQPYLDCCRLRELEPQRFTAIADAIGWLKSHREEVLVGSSIVIAGVVFVAVSAGAGTLVLVPVVLMASSFPSSGASTAQVSP
ncbi:MAG TPA: hypothetical protein VEU33_45960 [Archangium sp.]|nr:hypothetical protein [Archangium sp.]